MSLTLKDRCKQKIVANAGTGNVTLSVAVKGFKTISDSLSDGDTSYFCLESGNGDWEVFSGTYNADDNTVSRDTVLASSNSGNKINIGTSITFCYIVYPASKAIYKDGSDRAVIGSAGLVFSDSTVQTTAYVGIDLTTYATKAYVDSAVGAVDLSSRVPYTGASQAVNLGSQNLSAGRITATGAGVALYINRSGMSSFSIGDANGDTFRIQNAGDASDMLRIHGGTKAATFYGAITSPKIVVDNSDSSNIGADVRPWVQVKSNLGALTGYLGSGASVFTSVANGATDLGLRAVGTLGLSAGNSVTPHLSIATSGAITASETIAIGPAGTGSTLISGSEIIGRYAGAERGRISFGGGGGHDTWINNQGFVHLGNSTNGNSAVIIGQFIGSTTVRTNVVKTPDRAYFGGYTGAGHHLQITSGDPSGTNMPGGDIIVSGGRGTGSGAGGSIKFQTASAGTTGSTLNALVDRMTISQHGLATFTFNTAVLSNGLLVSGSDGNTYATLGYSGIYGLNSMVGMDVLSNIGRVNIGAGQMHITHATGNRSRVLTFGNLELSPGGLGGGGTSVEINNGTPGTLRDLSCRAIMASGGITTTSIGATAAANGVLSFANGFSANQAHLLSQHAGSSGGFDQLRLNATVSLSWAPNITTNSADIRLLRYSTGRLALLANNGLAVRDYLDSADAPLTAGAITASGAITAPSIQSSSSLFIDLTTASEIRVSVFGNQYRFGDSVAGLNLMGKDLTCRAITASGDVTATNSTAGTVRINTTGAASYSTIVFAENGTDKSYFTHINSTYTDVSRRNGMEFYNAGGQISFWTGGNYRRLQIENSGAINAYGRLTCTTIVDARSFFNLSSTSGTQAGYFGTGESLNTTSPMATTDCGIRSVGSFFVSTNNSTTPALVVSPAGAVTASGLVTVGGNLALTLAVYQTSEPVNTPTGTTQAITLNNDNHQTLDLGSATGAVTATLTVPSGSSAGTIIVKQHASSAKGITWAVSAGTIKWLGTEPTWGSDAVGSYRIISWRYNGSIMFLMSTDVG